MPDLNCAVLRLTLTNHEDYERVSPMACVVAHGATARDSIESLTSVSIAEVIGLRVSDDGTLGAWDRSSDVAKWLLRCVERGEPGHYSLTFDLAVEGGLADEEWLAHLHVFSLAHMLDGQDGP